MTGYLATYLSVKVIFTPGINVVELLSAYTGCPMVAGLTLKDKLLSIV
jgi:hypothetical protein